MGECVHVLVLGVEKWKAGGLHLSQEPIGVPTTWEVSNVSFLPLASLTHSNSLVSTQMVTY